MKVSTKGRYGLRIMLELGLSYNKNLLTAKELASRQDISDKYVEQIISSLNKAGLVRSQRGANGGYCLAEDPKNITVGNVLRATEGGIQVVDCIGDNKLECSRRETCVTMGVWQEIKEAVETVVDNITIEDLIKKEQEDNEFIYQI